jgi:hypothetical protein
MAPGIGIRLPDTAIATHHICKKKGFRPNAGIPCVTLRWWMGTSHSLRISGWSNRALREGFPPSVPG